MRDIFAINEQSDAVNGDYSSTNVVTFFWNSLFRKFPNILPMFKKFHKWIILNNEK